jgi:hypothetical protein
MDDQLAAEPIKGLFYFFQIKIIVNLDVFEEVVLDDEEKPAKTNGKRGRPAKTRWDSQEKVDLAKINNGTPNAPMNSTPFDWKVCDSKFFNQCIHSIVVSSKIWGLQHQM